MIYSSTKSQKIQEKIEKDAEDLARIVQRLPPSPPHAPEIEPPRQYGHKYAPLADKRYDTLGWREVGHTSSQTAWDNQSEDLAQCIINAPWSYYSWIIFSINDKLTIPEHQELWEKVRGALGRIGIILFWSRDWSDDGKTLHYDLWLKTSHDAKTIRQTIKRIIPDVKHNVRHPTKRERIKAGLENYRYETLRNEPLSKRDVICIVRYILKTNKHKHKRVFWEKKLGLNKYGTIGNFWENKKQELLNNWRKAKKLWKQNKQKNTLEQQPQPQIRQEDQLEQQPREVIKQKCNRHITQEFLRHKIRSLNLALYLSEIQWRAIKSKRRGRLPIEIREEQ